MVARCDDLSAQRVHIELERVRTNEALHARLAEQHLVERREQEDKLAAAAAAAREAAGASRRAQFDALTSCNGQNPPQTISSSLYSDGRPVSAAAAATHMARSIDEIERLALREVVSSLGADFASAGAASRPFYTPALSAPQSSASISCARSGEISNASSSLGRGVSADQSALSATGVLAPPSRGSAALAARRLAGVIGSPLGENGSHCSNGSSAGGPSASARSPHRRGEGKQLPMATPMAAALLQAGLEASQAILSQPSAAGGDGGGDDDGDGDGSGGADGGRHDQTEAAPAHSPEMVEIESGLPPLPRGGIATPAAYRDDSSSPPPGTPAHELS